MSKTRKGRDIRSGDVIQRNGSEHRIAGTGDRDYSNQTVPIQGISDSDRFTVGLDEDVPVSW